MALVDHLRAYDRRVSPSEIAHLPREPARRWAVVSCMDSRMHLERICALAEGDAHMLRNAGAVVTDDVIRSLVISSYVLGTNEFAIIGHTGCGLLTLDDAALRDQVAKRAGAEAASALHIATFHDLDTHVREQVGMLTGSRYFAPGLLVSGWIFDLASASLKEVVAARTGEVRV